VEVWYIKISIVIYSMWTLV